MRKLTLPAKFFFLKMEFEYPQSNGRSALIKGNISRPGRGRPHLGSMTTGTQGILFDFLINDS